MLMVEPLQLMVSLYSTANAIVHVPVYHGMIKLQSQCCYYNVAILTCEEYQDCKARARHRYRTHNHNPFARLPGRETAYVYAPNHDYRP